MVRSVAISQDRSLPFSPPSDAHSFEYSPTIGLTTDISFLQYPVSENTFFRHHHWYPNSLSSSRIIFLTTIISETHLDHLLSVCRDLYSSIVRFLSKKSYLRLVTNLIHYVVWLTGVRFLSSHCSLRISYPSSPVSTLYIVETWLSFSKCKKS